MKYGDARENLKINIKRELNVQNQEVEGKIGFL